MPEVQAGPEVNIWSVVFVGFMQLIALKTRSAATTSNPVTYVMEALRR